MDCWPWCFWNEKEIAGFGSVSLWEEMGLSKHPSATEGQLKTLWEPAHSSATGKQGRLLQVFNQVDLQPDGEQMAAMWQQKLGVGTPGKESQFCTERQRASSTAAVGTGSRSYRCHQSQVPWEHRSHSGFLLKYRVLWQKTKAHKMILKDPSLRAGTIKHEHLT